ncbi:MAG: hypothetical protein JZU70_09905, partial [Chlorobium sp.]|nr:hypothetical protein [Chlorobium sp.]
MKFLWSTHLTLNTTAENGTVHFHDYYTYLDDPVTITRGSGGVEFGGYLYSQSAERNNLTFNGSGGGGTTDGGAISINWTVGGSSIGANSLGDIQINSVTDLTIGESVSAKSLVSLNSTGALRIGSHSSYSQVYDGVNGLQLKTTGTDTSGDQNIYVYGNISVTNSSAPISISAPNGAIDFYSYADLTAASGNITLSAGTGALTLGAYTDLTSNNGLISLTGVGVSESSVTDSAINAGSGKIRIDGGGGTVTLYDRLVTTNADSGNTPAILITNTLGNANLRSVTAQTGTLQAGLVGGTAAIAPSQDVSGAGSLVLMQDGLRLRTPQQITLTSPNANTGVTFTITGTDAGGGVITDTITTLNNNTVTTTNTYKTITSITTSGAATGVSAGIASNDTVGGSLVQNTYSWGTDKIDIKTLSAATTSAISITSANNIIDQLGNFSVGSSLEVDAKGRIAGMALTGDVTATDVIIKTGQTANNGILSLGTKNITATSGNVLLRGRGITQSAGSTITSTGTTTLYGSDYASGTRSTVTLAGSIVSASTVIINDTNDLQLGDITIGSSGSRGALYLGEDTTLTYGTGGSYYWTSVAGAITQASGTAIKVGTLSAYQNSGAITLANSNNEIRYQGDINRGGAFSIFDKDTESNGLTLTGWMYYGSVNNAINIETLGALNLGSNYIYGQGITLSATSILDSSGTQVWADRGTGGDLVLQANGGNITLTGDYRTTGAGNDIIIRRAGNVQLGGYTYSSSVLELGSLGTSAKIAGSQTLTTGNPLTLATTSFGPAERVSIAASTGDISSVTFAVTGADMFGRPQTENIIGVNTGSKYFSSISSITTSGTGSGTVTVGTADEKIAGNVTQYNSIGDIPTIKGQVGGSVTLTNNSNQFQQIGTFTAGTDLFLRSQTYSTLTVTGAVVSTAGNVNIENYYYNLTVGSAGSVTANTANKSVTLKGSANTSGYTTSVQGAVSAGSGGINLSSTYGAVSTSGSGILTSTGQVTISSYDGYTTAIGAAVSAGEGRTDNIVINSGSNFNNTSVGTLTATGSVWIKTYWNGTNNRSLTLAGNVTAGDGGIQLTSSGTINQTGGILSTTGALSGPTQSGSYAPTYDSPSARGAVTLNQADNEVASLGAFYVQGANTNAFTFNDLSGGLTLAGTIENAFGAVNITTHGGALALGANSVYAGGRETGGNNVSLTGQGISQAAGSSISTTGGTSISPRTGSNGGGTITLTGHDGTASGLITLSGGLSTAKADATAITIRGTSNLALPTIAAPSGYLVLGDDTATIG